MSIDQIFPHPRHLTQTGATVTLGLRPVQFSLPDGGTPLLQRAAALVSGDTSQGTAQDNPYHIRVRLAPDAPEWPTGPARDEAYILDLGTERGELVGATEEAVFYGAQTLRQLLRGRPTTLPALRIVDWPDLRYRGLYVESKWGPDLMTLDDWKALVEYMAALKFNVLGIGVHGCWVVQYGGQRTEFVMLPFPDHPGFVTPKTLRYYSPAHNEWQTLDYVPPMVTHDFFGEVVAYAKAHNIAVRPHFNAPGHNTLLPRLYPELSAKHEDGTPIHYGFCLSDERTYELIFGLYDRVIDRYLRPHGLDWFHIGLDEVEGYQGIDPGDPLRTVDPWCRCPQCRDKPRAGQLQEYAVRICTHLKARGINHITMWNDALEKLDALDACFVAMLNEAGLREHVVVQWWRYNEPTLLPRPDLGVRAWVTPMAGYWTNLFTQSYTANIYPMLIEGARSNAEGADAYCIYDPAYDRNYTCLAQYAWNQTTGGDLYQFKSRYAQATLGRWLGPHRAAEAWEKYDQVFDSIPWTGSVLNSLLYYWHTYPAARAHWRYPRDVFTDLLASHTRLRNALGSVAQNARAARALFAEAATHDARFAQERAECDKVIGVWESFALVLDALTQYRRAVQSDHTSVQPLLESAVQQARAARERFVAMMAEQERVKAPFLLPQTLRDLSVALLYIEQLGDEFKTLAHQLATGAIQILPPLEQLAVNQQDFDVLVSTRQDDTKQIGITL